MIAVILVVVVAGTAGMAAGRHVAGSERIARFVLATMLYALYPIVTYANVAHLRLTTQIGVGLALAYAALAVTAVAGWQVGTRVLRLERPQTGALICAVMLGNTAYLGLPLTSAVLGNAQLPAAVLYDQVVSTPTLLIAGFGVGAAFGTRGGVSAPARVRAFAVRNPPLLALLAGLLAGPSLAPGWLLDVSHVVVLALLPLGFVVVGVNIAAHARPVRPSRRALGAAVGLRLVLAPLLLLGLSWTVFAVPDAYKLQAAMPTAVNSLVVAHAYGLDLPLCSAAIGWTTAAALVVGLAASLLF